MKLTEFYYHLPRKLIAMHPAHPRDHSRLMRSYKKAMKDGYRFYDYGDAMLML